MTMRMLLATSLVLGAAACTPVASGDLTVTNQSNSEIVEMHVTPTQNVDWSRNLLGHSRLLPGQATLIDTSCDVVDVLLVDEHGVDCEVDDVDLCLNAGDFVIHNDTCLVFGAAR